MLERCEFCELNEDVLRECGGFNFLFATEEEEWTFLHGRRTLKEGMQPMHTRLMYFDLILLRTE